MFKIFQQFMHRHYKSVTPYNMVVLNKFIIHVWKASCSSFKWNMQYKQAPMCPPRRVLYVLNDYSPLPYPLSVDEAR